MLRIIIGIFFLLEVTSICSPAAIDPYEILKECDQSRGNFGGVTWTVSVEALEDSQKSSREILVKSRGFDVVAETLSPPLRKGYLLLLVKGNMWFYKPDLSKPVPVSQRQKLLGLAVNGDIASTNYAHNYTILSQQDVTLDGRDCYLFELAAKEKNSTYSHIKYWVLKDPHIGVKAEFYTTGGRKLLKSATMKYDNRIIVDENERPFISEMIIHDELMSENTTTLKFSRPVVGQIPARTFNLNFLGR